MPVETTADYLKFHVDQGLDKLVEILSKAQEQGQHEIRVAFDKYWQAEIIAMNGVYQYNGCIILDVHTELREKLGNPNATFNFETNPEVDTLKDYSIFLVYYPNSSHQG